MSKRFRTGGVNAAGGRPLKKPVKVYECVTADDWYCSDTTSGDHGCIAPSNYNTPLKISGNTTWTTGGAGDRHPSGHQTMVTDNYTTVQVLDADLRIHAVYCGATLLDTEIVLGYKFDSDATTTTPAFTAGTATTEHWLDLQASPGWVWNRMGCNHTGGHGMKTYQDVHIKMKNMPSLTTSLFKNTAITQFTNDDLKSVIADSDAGPLLAARLHIVVFAIRSGGVPAALAANAVWLQMRLKQRVRCWTLQTHARLVDEGDYA